MDVALERLIATNTLMFLTWKKGLVGKEFRNKMGIRSREKNGSVMVPLKLHIFPVLFTPIPNDKSLSFFI